MPDSTWQCFDTDEVVTIDGHDGYPLCVRVWNSVGTPVSTIVLLHGVVSHSEWLAPVARRLSEAGHKVVCPDRRGTGLNTAQPGDAPGAAALIEDIKCVIDNLCPGGIALHVGGFCWGATYAVNVLEHDRFGARSLLMLAPSFFPAADIAGADLCLGDSAQATEQPNVPIDRFTTGPAYTHYIIPDPLRTKHVSPRFNSILVRMNRMLAPRWAKLNLPVLMIQATSDRLSDTVKHERAFSMLKVRPVEQQYVEAEHGLQFDAPDKVSGIIDDWVTGESFS